jgi:predicted MFS family arabinose efflux permease
MVQGPPETRRLTLTHALDDLGDGLVNISLVGSLFFSVSLEASRDRILLYLVLTVAPLAVIAPIIGPLLERTRAGYRTTMVGSQLVRAVAAIFLASSLKSPVFYPLVFIVLLSRKAYALSRTAMLPQLVDQSDRLADASGHLSRIGTVAGGVGTAIGGAGIALFGAEAVPVLAMPAFLAAAVAASRIRVRVDTMAHPATATTVRTGVPPHVRRAGIAVCGIRAANGALTYLLAFAIKRGGVGSWVFVVALAVAGVGSYLGTLITGALLRRTGADQVVAIVLLVPGVVTLFSVLAAGDMSIVMVAFTIGLGSSVATRTMDALYAEVPDVARGRAISGNELRFQLSNVTGAVMAVMLTPTPRVGFFVVAGVLLVSGVSYASQRRLSIRRGAGAFLLGNSLYSPTTMLPRTLLDEATLQGQQGARRLAIVTAHAAVRSALAQGAADPPDDWPQFQAAGDAVLAGSPATDELVEQMLAAARQAVAQMEPTPRPA